MGDDGEGFHGQRSSPKHPAPWHRTYRIKANLDGVDSDPSNPATASTLSWKVAYRQLARDRSWDADDAAYTGNTLVRE
jgi:hypothetical protein